MKFLIGSQNYGLDHEGSDKDYLEIVFPKLGDLCRPVPRKKERKEEDNSMTRVVDIRDIPDYFYKSNLDTLQLLYSKEKTNSVVTDYFKEHEFELSTMNIPRLYQSITGQAKSRFEKKTSKDLAHIIFGFETLIKFEEQGFVDLRACFEHGNSELYYAIRAGEYDHWYQEARRLECLAKVKEDSYKSFPVREDFLNKMKEDFGRIILNRLS